MLTLAPISSITVRICESIIHFEHRWDEILTGQRNLDLLIVIMALTCCIHTAAAELIPMRKSKREALVFHRSRATAQRLQDDVESASKYLTTLKYKTYNSLLREPKIEPQKFYTHTTTFSWDSLNTMSRSKMGLKEYFMILKDGSDQDR